MGDALTETVLRGGYPEAVSRATPRRRTAWARQYVDALIQRDVRDVAGKIGLDHKTAARYVGVFEQMYLLNRVAPWGRNRLSRVVKTPKLQFIDSGLLSTLVELSPDAVRRDRTRFGHVLETFVYGELRKHATTAEGYYSLGYYRDHDQIEVDIVVENRRGDVVGVEVKASASVMASDFRGLKQLASLAGEQFKLGVILYDGTETLPMGDRLWAAPISTLWGSRA